VLAVAPKIEHQGDGHSAASSQKGPGHQHGLAWSRDSEALDQIGDENGHLTVMIQDWLSQGK
jgi:hypothetical protein